jgi:chromosome segregation ATPase
MAKTTPAPVPAETSPEEVHQQAYTRAMAGLRELQRQIDAQERVIAGKEADLEEIHLTASTEEAEVRAWQEENERISAELTEAHLAMGLYQGTARAAALQERIDGLESRQGALASLLTDWNQATIQRTTSYASAKLEIDSQLAADRATLAEMQEQAGVLLQAAEDAHRAMGQARLERITATLAELAQRKEEAERQAKSADMADRLLRSQVAAQLAEFPELAKEAKHLGPPEPPSQAQRVKEAGLTFLETLWRIGRSMDDWTITDQLLRSLAITQAELADLLSDKGSFPERERRFVNRRDTLTFAPVSR